MKVIKQYPIITYVTLVFVLSIAPYLLMYQAGDSESDWVILLMWVPALAAIANRLLTKQSLLKAVYWNPIKSVKWLAIAMLVPLLISFVCVGLQVVFGFVEFNPHFLVMENGELQVHGIAMIFGADPQPPILFIGNFLLSFFVGNLIYMIVFALGEEYGWRAHLQPLLLKKYSERQTFVIVGIIWGLWHFPGILLGHNYPEYPVLGGLLLMPITCIAFSFAFGTACMKAKSVWVPIMFHSALNLSSNMDDKMITTKTNVLGADLIWTGLWILTAIYFAFQLRSASRSMAP